uniref:hypothetical protein n=1 Tax=Alistipes sp. TaxID=1872444 RepID=UPI0040573EC2
MGKVIVGKWLNLRHEPTALLCRFDWLHLGIVHNRYALCRGLRNRCRELVSLTCRGLLRNLFSASGGGGSAECASPLCSHLLRPSSVSQSC